MRSIFIAGGTGFFGKSMLDYRLRHPMMFADGWTILSRNPARFLAENPQFARLEGVEFVAGDVRDFNLPRRRFDAVIHAATPAVTTLDDDEMTSIIVDGTRHVIDFAKTCGASKLMLTSSGAVYGGQSAAVAEDAACKPTTAYGKGKLLAEQMCCASGLNALLPRCFAFAGPYLNRGMHFAIGNFVQSCLDGAPIVVKGDGTPLRSYLYADDLVEWLFAILERGESGRPYNVGSDVAVSILELAETVQRVLGGSGKIVVRETPQPGTVPSAYVPKIERARRELGLSVKTDLESAILKTVKGGGGVM